MAELEVCVGPRLFFMKNACAVVLFENVQHKLKVLKQFKSEETLVIGCGQRSLRHAEWVPDMQLLMARLQALLDDTHPFRSQVLTLLLIEDLSTFFWLLKLQGRRQAYRRLNEVLHTVRVRYGCNIIVTAWDNAFEKGFAYKPVESEAHALDDLTYMPGELFDNVQLWRVGNTVWHYDSWWVKAS